VKTIGVPASLDTASADLGLEGVSGVGMLGFVVYINMCARTGAGRVLGWCVIAAVILGHNGAKGVEVTSTIAFLKMGSEIAELIYRMWNELGKPASRWL
jgi:hypothetical protein